MTFNKVSASPAVDLNDIGTFRAEYFPESSVRPWLDEPNYAERIDGLLRQRTIDEQQAELCRLWAKKGYVVIERMFGDCEIDAAWKAYEHAIADSVVSPQPDYGQGMKGKIGRVLNPHFKVPAFNALLHAKAAVELVSLLLGVKALPFQTIAGHVGSQQQAHSDSIHMTTYPKGYLVANWIAFEDIAGDSGPLELYPGSHRLDYLLSKECGIALDEGKAGYAAYHAKYEPAVQNLIREHDLKAEYFLAKKGDVLFWHANLLHGGSPIRNPDSSRCALVCHYFAEGCVCYHDYTGTPSYLTKFPMMPRDRFDPQRYLDLNPDVAAAGVDPYEHYVRHGHAEGRRVK
jgi:Phytanoyl-CoA dioxygenase (PhyH)